MKAEHLEILVEEPSMEAFLREILPKLIGEEASFEVYPFQCKKDLLSKLSARLRGYARWLPKTWRVVIVVDRDDDDCRALKESMEQSVSVAGLRTRKAAPETWQVVTRIAIEELEAWYFGDWEAVHETYQGVPRGIPQRAPYRNPDEVLGGTWEQFERILQRAGYFKAGLRKVEVARVLGKRSDPARSRSRSFQSFRDAVLEALS